MERLFEFIGNHPFLVSLFIAILGLLIWNIYAQALRGVPAVNSSEATRLINRENAALIDLRSVSDFESGHIINSRNIAANELTAHLQELKKYKKQAVIVYCRDGAQSSRQASSLMDEGFEQVYYLKGGLMEWANANLPLARKG